MALEQITEKIIGAAFRVHNQLGFGFLESVYEKSLFLELQELGLAVESQVPIQVYYDEQIVGNFKADLLVEKEIIIELKSTQQIIPAHEVQLVNYLTATKLDIGLLINFGPQKVEVKRKYRLPKQSQ